MDAYLTSDYQIVLIVITIIGFIISTAFYVYFVYLPASRIEDQFEIINKQGEGLIDRINERIDTVEGETVEVLSSICSSIQAIICGYNNTIFGDCQGMPGGACALSTKAYPDFCNQFFPFNPSCTCTND